MNKKVVLDLLKEQSTEKSDAIATEQFFSVLEGIGAPLESDNKVKLLAIYDKKGEGKINYGDFLTEQKFVHAVSVYVCMVCVCVCVCVRERERERSPLHVYMCI